MSSLPPPSGDPQPYFDALTSAVDNVGATAQLITVISAIVDDAEITLSGDELDAVYAASSVAVDSYNYWVTENGVAITTDSLNEAYDGCLRQEDPHVCFYDSLKQFDGADGRGSSVRFASLVPQGGWIWCSNGFSVGGIVKADIQGAAAGWLAGGGGGAAAGALGGSAAESLWQISYFLACLMAA